MSLVEPVRGGKREGAGRKSKFSEPTSPIRLPISLILEIKEKLKRNNREIEITDIHKFEAFTKVQIPVASWGVQAGFASPAQDHIDKTIDLNEQLIHNQNATFIVRVNSLSMFDAGLDVGDSLIVDRSLDAQNNDIVIAYIDDGFTVKRLQIDSSGVWLKAENKSDPELYPNIYPKDGQELMIWGVVTGVYKKFR